MTVIAFISGFFIYIPLYIFSVFLRKIKLISQYIITILYIYEVFYG